jgi:Glycosyl hydrolase family 26/Ca-dependent carbohydrate-binding module xylan-binding
VSVRRARHRPTSWLVVAALAGAAVGGPGLPAQAATTSVPRLQGELMTWRSGAGYVFRDVKASGGSGLVLTLDGAAQGWLTAPADGTLKVRARADSCSGAAAMTVSVDRRVEARLSVAATGWKTYSVASPWAGGRHRVTVAFTNNFRGGGCDRNLRLDALTVQPAGGPAKAAPALPSHIFGLSSTGPDQGISTAQATAAKLGRRLDIVNFYKAWVWGGGLPVEQLQAIADAGARPEITWEPWDPRNGSSQPAYSLAGIASGEHDDYIEAWAKEAAAYRQPILIRFGHEMNGSWYPWAPASTGASPASYVAAYRHVHDIFRAAGADNVSWVWSPNIVQGMHTTLASLYPGSRFVDVIGVDGYNGGSEAPDMGGWRTPAQIFDPTLTELRTLAPGKPVIINETGSAEDGGSKAEWIAQLFAYLPTKSVSGVVWFDFDAAPRGDWRFSSSPESIAAAKRALSRW